MASKEQYKTVFDLINKSFEQAKVLNVENLVREKDLGIQLSFKSAEELLVKALALIQRIKGCDLNGIPFNTVNNLANQLQAVIQYLQAINTFNPSAGNPLATRNQLIANLENQYEAFSVACKPVLIENLLKTNELSTERAKFEQLIQTLQAEKEKLLQESTENSAQIKMLLEKARQVTSQVGVVSNSGVFLNESKRFRVLAIWWFVAMIAILVSVMGISMWLLNIIPDSTKGTEYFIQFTVARLIILSVLFYGIGICNKNYKAYKHNEILNKHRHNALNSFETFTKAAGDDIQTKNAVLLEATHTIFSNQQTGYLASESDSDNPNKIVEIVKNITSKSQSGN